MKGEVKNRRQKKTSKKNRPVADLNAFRAFSSQRGTKFERSCLLLSLTLGASAISTWAGAPDVLRVLWHRLLFFFFSSTGLVEGGAIYKIERKKCGSFNVCFWMYVCPFLVVCATFALDRHWSCCCARDCARLIASGLAALPFALVEPMCSFPWTGSILREKNIKNGRHVSKYRC